MNKKELEILIRNNLPIAIKNRNGKWVYPFANMKVPKVIVHNLCNALSDEYNNIAYCGHCNKKLTLVRPGKHQCDNDNCKSNK